jgi:hypothetical protein
VQGVEFALDLRARLGRPQRERSRHLRQQRRVAEIGLGADPQRLGEPFGLRRIDLCLAQARRRQTALQHAMVWDAIGRLIDLIAPNESANFFTAAGYEPE